MVNVTKLVLIMRTLKERIIRDYRKPGTKIAFSGISNVAKTFGISPKRAQKILEEIDSYTLFKQSNRPSAFNPYIIDRRRKIYQTDLIEMPFHEDNDSVRLLLVLVDMFSRRAYVYPLLRKTALSVRQAFAHWLERLTRDDDFPLEIQSDHGREYKNKKLKELLNGYGIRQNFVTYTSMAGIAERFNKTLQTLIYKFMEDRQTTRYIDVLKKLVSSYNKRGHRTLANHSPLFADKKRNRNTIFQIHQNRVDKIRKMKPKYKVGDTVRIKVQPRSAIAREGRAYARQFQTEYFTVARVKTKQRIPLYEIRSMDTGEDIKGSFYGHELSRTPSNVFKVDRIIKYKGKGRNRRALVKWKYFGKQHNSWIPVKDIKESY